MESVKSNELNKKEIVEIEREFWFILRMDTCELAKNDWIESFPRSTNFLSSIQSMWTNFSFKLVCVCVMKRSDQTIKRRNHFQKSIHLKCHYTRFQNVELVTLMWFCIIFFCVRAETHSYDRLSALCWRR